MNHSEFFTVMRYIDSQDDGKHWPHNLQPGSTVTKDGGIDETEDGMFTPNESSWNETGYNPPGFALEVYPEADPRPTVRTRPTWKQIEEAHLALSPARLSAMRIDVLYILSSEVRSRITRAFGAKDELDELFIRQAGEDTQAQRDERARLLARHRAIRTSLESLSMEQLETFDPTDDSIWIDPAGASS